MNGVQIIAGSMHLCQAILKSARICRLSLCGGGAHCIGARRTSFHTQHHENSAHVRTISAATGTRVIPSAKHNKHLQLDVQTHLLLPTAHSVHASFQTNSLTQSNPHKDDKASCHHSIVYPFLKYIVHLCTGLPVRPAFTRSAQ